MKLFTILSLVTFALAAAVDKRDGPIAVSIEQTSNTGLKATITNTGASSIKVFKAGSILDSNLIEKTEIFSGGKSLIPCHFCPTS